MECNISIWLDSDGKVVDDHWIEMQSDYSNFLIEEFKDLIPHIDRSWDQQTKIWTFRPYYLPGVREIAFKWAHTIYLYEHLVDGSVYRTELRSGERIKNEDP